VAAMTYFILGLILGTNLGYVFFAVMNMARAS
jgi:hypothetical protein